MDENRSLLPDNIYVKSVTLNDFMWFMGRSERFNSNKEKMDNFRHLKLKANLLFEVSPDETKCFKCFERESIRNLLGTNM